MRAAYLSLFALVLACYDEGGTGSGTDTDGGSDAVSGSVSEQGATGGSTESTGASGTTGATTTSTATTGVDSAADGDIETEGGSTVSGTGSGDMSEGSSGGDGSVEDAETENDEGCPANDYVGHAIFDGETEPVDLTGVTRLVGDLRVITTDQLGGDALACLEVIQGSMIVSNLKSVSDQEPFNSLTRLREVTGTIQMYQVWFEDLDFLRNLESIGGELDLTFFRHLKHVDGLAGLHTIGGKLFFRSLVEVESLEGLSNLTHVGGSVEIGDMEALLVWGEWSKLEEIPGRLDIGASPAPRVRAFSAVREIGRDLSIHGTKLTDLSDLSSITRIGGTLSLVANSTLERLDGLEALTTIGDDIRVVQNDSLVSVKAAHQLTLSGNRFEAEDNPALDSCRIKDWVDSINGLDDPDDTIIYRDNLANGDCPDVE